MAWLACRLLGDLLVLCERIILYISTTASSIYINFGFFSMFLETVSHVQVRIFDFFQKKPTFGVDGVGFYFQNRVVCFLPKWQGWFKHNPQHPIKSLSQTTHIPPTSNPKLPAYHTQAVPSYPIPLEVPVVWIIYGKDICDITCNYLPQNELYRKSG